MVWLLYFSGVALIVVLACGFFTLARAIRRDVDRRFREVETRLEEEANDLVKHLLRGGGGEPTQDS